MSERSKPADQLRDIAQGIRSRHEVRTLKKQLDRCREELSVEMEKYGQACFEESNEAARLRQGVAALQSQSRNLEKRIDELTGILRCPDCGLEMTETDAFCRRCGYALRKGQPSPGASIVWPDEKPESDTI